MVIKIKINIDNHKIYPHHKVIIIVSKYIKDVEKDMKYPPKIKIILRH